MQTDAEPVFEIHAAIRKVAERLNGIQPLFHLGPTARLRQLRPIDQRTLLHVVEALSDAGLTSYLAGNLAGRLAVGEGMAKDDILKYTSIDVLTVGSEEAVAALGENIASDPSYFNSSAHRLKAAPGPAKVCSSIPIEGYVLTPLGFEDLQGNVLPSAPRIIRVGPVGREEFNECSRAAAKAYRAATGH